MKRSNTETVIVCAVTAAFGAFGIIVGAAAFLGVRFGEKNIETWLGAGLILGAVLWGILLLYNRKMAQEVSE